MKKNKSKLHDFIFSEKNKNIANLFNKYESLNEDLSHFCSNDDICTPLECVQKMLECVQKMIEYIPEKFWQKEGIKVLDPCCGNGNFGALMQFLIPMKQIYFNDINKTRIKNCKDILKPINIWSKNFFDIDDKFDLIIGNPPYFGGGNKNKSLSNHFIEHSIDLLKKGGFLCFITPNNWMSYSKSNTTLKKMLSSGSFLVIDNECKKFFSSVGSSFSIFVWQKGKFNKKTLIINNYLIKDTQEVRLDKKMKFIPLYCSQTILDIVNLCIQDEENNIIKYRCDLHNFTKSKLLNNYEISKFKYRTIHTARQTRWACIKQDIYDKFNIIIPLSTYFIPWIDTKQNVTQSVAYISCQNMEEAKKKIKILQSVLFRILIHLTRYGNFNNLCILKHLNFNYKHTFFNEQLSIIKSLNDKIKNIYEQKEK